MSVTPRSAALDPASAVERLDPHESQLLWRRINAHIVEVSQSVRFASAIDVVCECARPGCFELVRASPGDYDAVRQSPFRFLVKPGHVTGDEQVIDERRRFVVVETTTGGARPATANEPSDRGSPMPTPTRGRRDWLWDGD